MQGFTHAPEGIVQGIYAKYAGLPLGQIATALLLTRILDAVTYPLIGHWSDATARRFGTRKPWIAVGAVVTILGLWNLFRPPPHVGVGYFGGWMMVAYVGWKLTEIPYGAWSFALSSDYVQRTRIQAWRGVAIILGSLLFYVVPFVLKATGLGAGTEFNLQTLSSTAILILVVVPLLTGYSLWMVPEGVVARAVPDHGAPLRGQGIRNTWHAVRRNDPLIRFLAAFAPVTFLVGMANGVVYLYADTYLHQSEHLALILLVAMPLTLLGIPFWGWCCAHFERHRVWAVSLMLGSLSCGALWFVPSGPAGFLPMIVIYPLIFFCSSAVLVVAPAMLGDISDFGRLEYGEDHSGMYSALFAFIQKSLGGLSTAAGITVVGWFGFEAAATAQTSWGVFGIKMVAVLLPACGMLCSAPIVWGFPINRARQDAIRSALRTRAVSGDV
jgi:Na+/melibiose symporter-like transporter